MSKKNFELCNHSWELNYHARKGILIQECVDGINVIQEVLELTNCLLSFHYILSI
jgi:hypothetical protein